MKDYQKEVDERVGYIRSKLKESGCSGIIFGNSGGKDCALVGILCKKACENTVGVMMPCSSPINYQSDIADAKLLAEKYGIENRIVDLGPAREELLSQLEASSITKTAETNIAPRLRMLTLYAIAQSENRLVAGTGNRSEIYMGYFTKWGDGGYDFNPIADLTVKEVYEMLEFLGAPEDIIKKVPSAGLYEGQSDEKEMGVSYEAIDRYILTGEGDKKDIEIIERFHRRSEHKRRLPSVFRKL